MTTFIQLLSAPEYLGPLVSAFHMGMDQAVFFYASNPRMAVSIVAFFVFMIYYLREVVKKPEIFAREGKFKWFVKANCTALNEHYWPTCWAFGTHAQTSLANAIRYCLPDLKYDREYIQCPDGGQVSLDWYEDTNPSSASQLDENSPIAVFIPGLTGDSQTEYIKSLIPYAQSCGYRAVGFNNRGRGGMKLLTPKLYCAANCEDLTLALSVMKERYPKVQVVATGVSLGGILLSRHLIEMGANTVVDVAVLISVCFDLIKGAASMEKMGLNYALNAHLAKSLVGLVVDQQHILKDLPQINYTDVCGARTLKEFDSRFTTNMWGYESVEDYYSDASNAGKLHRIRVPTLCINAADDMFAPIFALPIKEIQDSEYMAMVVTQRGGHIGFMEGLMPRLPFFSEKLIHQFLSALKNVKDLRKGLS